MTGTIFPDSESTLSYQNLSTMLYAMQLIRATKTFEEGATTWKQTEITATECAIYFCVNLYNTTVDDGRLSERVTASWSSSDPSSYQAVSRTPGTRFDYLAESIYTPNFLATDVLRNDLEIAIPEHDRKKYGIAEDINFGLSQTAIQEIGSAFSDHFALLSRSNTSILSFTCGNDSNEPIRSTTSEEIMCRSDNLTATFQSIAQSLTTFIKDTSNLTHIGTPQEWTTYIQVDWSLLTVPLFSILLGFWFCVLCILQTRELRLKAWKTDLTATLAYSLDMEARDELRNAEQKMSLSQAARDMNVQFVGGADESELRKVV
ncbi:hypothetical protein F5Y19DRAFT_461942 [Xylariaceae sp. FL1651]|nr:hypothetical protein F5Y19DRAFT_461942 [Xylariaceae sp. FL1651]